MTAVEMVSPLHWVGGKHASAKRILAAFPPSSSFSTYVELFGGAAHMFVRKPPERHLEVYNDLNGNLVRFWMAARDHPRELQQRIDSLPYSRQLYYAYRSSLREHEPLDDLEQAARWFYVLRSSFGGHLGGTKGWGYVISSESKSNAQSLRSATALLSVVAARFRRVQIEHQDYAKIIQVYQTPRTLFYVDPPYIGHEEPYAVDGTRPFTLDDHHQLAALLNATPAMVALSYYEHPLLQDLYPLAKWRRYVWTQPQAVARVKGKQRQRAREVLLMNYPETVGLWEA